jgi:hypothetical protein
MKDAGDPWHCAEVSIALSRDSLREGRDTQLETAAEVAKAL